MKQYKSIDLAKFVCAILIIILHTAPFASYSRVLTVGFRNIITPIAVPFFFVASGFIAFKKIDGLAGQEQTQYVIKHLKRILVMYLIWSAVYFGFVVVKWTRAEDFSYWYVLEYVKDFFFEGSYSTIWFLPALFVAVLLVWLLHKKLSYKKMFLIACVVYLFTLGGSSYYGLVSKISFIKWIYDMYYSFFDTIKNGVCFGFIFVCMGAMLAEKEETVVAKGSMLQTLIGCGVCALLLAVEELAIGVLNWNLKGVDTVVMLVPFSWFFFSFLLKWDIKGNDELFLTLRKYSLLMFLCQRIPLSIIDLFMPNTLVATNSLVYFLVVLTSTLLIAFLIIQASKKVKVLKYLY